MAEAGRALLTVIGAALVGTGGYLHYPPLGFGLAGGMLFAIALIGTLRSR